MNDRLALRLHRIDDSEHEVDITGRLNDAIDAVQHTQGGVIHLGEERAVAYEPMIDIRLAFDRVVVTLVDGAGIDAFEHLVASLRSSRFGDRCGSDSGGAVLSVGPLSTNRHERYALSSNDLLDDIEPLGVLRVIEQSFVSSSPLCGLYGGLQFEWVYAAYNLPTPKHGIEPDDIARAVFTIPKTVTVFDFPAGIVDSYRVVTGEDHERGARTVAAVADIPLYDASFAPPEGTSSETYADIVRRARPFFQRGQLYEVVPSESHTVAVTNTAAHYYRSLTRTNAAPRRMFVNLGNEQYIIGASPEVFVRVTRDDDASGSRTVHSEPISGTVPRSPDPVVDERLVRSLLGSEKECAELTMCTDVDRNDKASICVPGSIRVTGRRKVMTLANLHHTYDVVEGRLLPECSGLDAALAHMWAVTLVGAPKRAALSFIADNERLSRGWYGALYGIIGFDGTADTTINIRTAVMNGRSAFLQAGATLLYDSVPSREEAEVDLKLSRIRSTFADESTPLTAAGIVASPTTCENPTDVILVDFEDCFAQLIADYLRQHGATVRIVSHLADDSAVEGTELVVLSPGPGTPTDMDVHRWITASVDAGVPMMGVCLGFQAMMEYSGARLTMLDAPVHGKGSALVWSDESAAVFVSDTYRDRSVLWGRYHSLAVPAAEVSDNVDVLAVSEDGYAMAASFPGLRGLGIQFHPESIISAEGSAGLRLLGDVLDWARIVGADRHDHAVAPH